MRLSFLTVIQVVALATSITSVSAYGGCHDITKYCVMDSDCCDKITCRHVVSSSSLLRIKLSLDVLPFGAW
ncbi:uncharacterized protein F5891DRAFT_608248 [Suillus fuscotomentosus]|uniref:Uncharacterized protein n=1 Tax=Suillus fuscotomentosus TaxID=1912939 RepID=A0AAD4E0B6_9AGAM|nr:uncharacterized protein F5891DRAFT_608248 [Suillus fuscotomentosus]KAG1896119.1 hypothetical protein F5891DRAFT_608248 [Suillus fuscotomentosus]